MLFLHHIKICFDLENLFCSGERFMCVFVFLGQNPDKTHTGDQKSDAGSKKKHT